MTKEQIKKIAEKAHKSNYLSDVPRIVLFGKNSVKNSSKKNAKD